MVVLTVVFVLLLIVENVGVIGCVLTGVVVTAYVVMGVVVVG